MPSEVRIGALGAARITPMALVQPAKKIEGVSLTAVEARERRRAESLSRKH